MHPTQPGRSALAGISTHAALGALLLIAPACDDSDPAPALVVRPPDSTSRTLSRGDSLPGIQLDIVSVTGGSGPGGALRAGDRPLVTFRVLKTDGTPWLLSDFDVGRILLSGPTNNYQRVIPVQDDLVAGSTLNGDRSYSYRFSAPLPSVYAPPYHDTTAFGPDDGELAGQPLQAGTHTLGIMLGWSYTVDGEPHFDAGDAIEHVLLGDASIPLGPRAVVSQQNCNECHGSLRYHGGIARNVELCILCHTAGAEDANDPGLAGGTPGVSIDFRVLIHKLHNGSHLPSVQGVATNADGSRNYDATPEPYQLASADGTLHDYSAASFPVMPSAYAGFLFNTSGTTYQGTGGNGPMPRDTGYGALAAPRRYQEDKIRTGMVDCKRCHGDPDGNGPLAPPVQGDLAFTNPQRQSCGSCHDDVEWGRPYSANGVTMGAQATNANCALCHAETGSNLAVRDAHQHPYSDPAFNTGVNVAVSAIQPGTGSGGNHLAGDPIVATFSVRDDRGDDLQIQRLTRFQMIVSGPSMNPQWVLPNVNAFDFAFRKGTPFTGNGTIGSLTVGAGAVAQTVAVIHTSATTFDVLGSTTTSQSFTIGAGTGSQTPVAYGGISFTVTQGATVFATNDRWFFEVVPTAPSYTVAVPRDFAFERLGTASGAAQFVPAGNTPVYWGRQVVYERTGLVGAAAPLGAAAAAMQRYVVADQSLLAAIATGDRVVLDAGTSAEEYLQVSRIQTTDDVTGVDLGTADRFFFASFLRYDHTPGATIQECTLSSRREGSDYTLATSSATGIDLLAGRFTAGNPVVMSYRSHARSGYFQAPGQPFQAVFTPATGDSDEIGASQGDWTGLPVVDGTYTVGMWANRDFTVSPSGAPVATEAWNNFASDNTTYRMMAPPATRAYLFGAATNLSPRQVIADGALCNKCHGDVAAHGFGRRGLDTCMLCHATSGAEDAPLYQYNGWYVGPTPGVSMEFRSLLHKVHMGRELANASSYVANGVFLGTPYPVRYGDIEFPVMPEGVNRCESCHGAGSTTWLQPADRNHPLPWVAGTREWDAACASCHDSDAASAHIQVMTAGSAESCAVCHGPGKEWSVQIMHKRY